MCFVLRALCLIALASIGLGGSYSPSYAGNVFQDMWGVATDPLKLSAASKELSESAERIMIQLSQLEGVANAHIDQRLEQMRSIIKDALNGATLSYKILLPRCENLKLR